MVSNESLFSYFQLNKGFRAVQKNKKKVFEVDSGKVGTFKKTLRLDLSMQQDLEFKSG